MPKRQPVSLPRVTIVVKTGVATLHRINAQLDTVLKDYPHLLIIGDSDQEVRGIKIHDVTKNVQQEAFQRILLKSPDEASSLPIVSASSPSPNSLAESGSAKDPEGEFDILDTLKGAGWKLDARKFFPGLRLANSTFPDLEWFLLVDDDSFVFIDSLIEYLATLDHDSPLYFGSLSMVDQGVCGAAPKQDHFVYGGAGIVLSRQAMRLLMETIDKCILTPWYWDCWAGDVSLGLCIQQTTATPLNIGTGFQGGPVTSPTFEFSQPACERVRTVHKLNVAQTRKLYGLVTDIRAKRKHVTMADVYTLFHPIEKGEKFEVLHNDDLLGGYGSSSDDDGNNSDRHQSALAHANQAPAKKKPTTKLLVVNLPEHPPSDDDDDGIVSAIPSKPLAKSGLFGFLPPPKSSQSVIPPKESSGNIVPRNILKRKLPEATSGTEHSTPAVEIPAKRSTSLVDDETDPAVSSERKEDFFTLDLPPSSASNVEFQSFSRPTVIHPFDSEPQISLGNAIPAGPSSSSSYVYSESAQYAYESETLHEAQFPEFRPHHEPALDDEFQNEPAQRYSNIQLDDAALHKLGHRSGTAVEIVDINHEDQLGGAETRLENMKNLSREKIDMKAIEHLKPSRLAKEKHNIMALAFQAKVREQELKEAYADRRQNRAASINKYGF
ncbi:hypothetical protein HDU83_005336 [Entophlyctis luteolus]|nr:hypothetical protein HDU83_005336 [Entophlyctis luteolus]